MNALNRRDVLKAGGMAAAVLAVGGSVRAAVTGEAASPEASTAGEADLLSSVFDAEGRAVLPPLPYANDALEPAIDAQTMEIHHDRHHKAYVDGYNAALGKLAEARANNSFDLVEHHARKLTFNGGGHVLHTLFWNTMTAGGSQPSGALAEAIDREFGSMDTFKAQFSNTAKSVEGSGWGVLSLNLGSGKLLVHQVQNQNLQSIWAEMPLVLVDVWEHAYYLKYQNDRAAYINAWMEVIDWNRAGERYDRLLQSHGRAAAI